MPQYRQYHLGDTIFYIYTFVSGLVLPCRIGHVHGPALHVIGSEVSGSVLEHVLTEVRV